MSDKPEAMHTPTPWVLKNDCISDSRPDAKIDRLKIISPWIEDAWEHDAEAKANMALIVLAVNSHARLLKEREELRAALEGVLSDIRDYERVNNLLPNPGREDCWQSVTRARATLLTLKSKD